MKIGALLLCLLLPDCGMAGFVRSLDTPNDNTAPLARAIDSSSARLVLITCATVARQADELVRILEALATQGPLVTARGAASASVTINICGGEVIQSINRLTAKLPPK